MMGTPYAVRTERPFASPLGCATLLRGEATAMNLEAAGSSQRPLGTTADHAPCVFGSGVFNRGALVTQGSLIFIGATLDNYLRAFDLESGRVVEGRLPRAGLAHELHLTHTESGMS
jgi:glucose dehydrogenase